MRFPIDSGAPPILLRLAEVQVGRKRMFMLSNELTLSDQELAAIYAVRWRVEVFVRTIKQNYECAKLHSRTPENAVIELDWTLLGLWLAFSQAGRCIAAEAKLSAIRVLRVLASLIAAVAEHSAKQLNVRHLLAQCVVAAEGNRKSEKNSKNYPRKKKKRPTGEPTLSPLPDALHERAAAAFT